MASLDVQWLAKLQNPRAEEAVEGGADGRQAAGNSELVPSYYFTNATLEEGVGLWDCGKAEFNFFKDSGFQILRTNSRISVLLAFFFLVKKI